MHTLPKKLMNLKGTLLMLGANDGALDGYEDGRALYHSDLLMGLNLVAMKAERKKQNLLKTWEKMSP